MPESLESKAFSGGIMLVWRELLGIILGSVGVLINTSLLGPQKYGQFAIIAGLSACAANVGKLGLNVYLIRHQGALEQRQVGVTQCLYLGLGLLLLAVGIALGPLTALWYGEPLLRQLFWAYAIVPPIVVMSGVPIALLDRDLAYKKAAGIDLMAQVIYLTISMPVIWFTRSVWGLVLGALGQALLVLIMASHISRIEFRPCWDWNEVKAQLRFGFGYAFSIWIWQARDLVNPLVIGKLLGMEAVGLVAMAIRLSDMVSFGKTVVWRIYLSLLTHLANNREKMKESLESGLNYQVIILGASIIAFLTAAPELIRGLLGEKWLPLLVVFPFIAAGKLLNGGFSLHSAALYVVGRTKEVSLFHTINTAIFALGAWYFASKMGDISGYGWAEILCFPSYLVIRRAVHTHLFVIREKLLYSNIIVSLAGVIIIVNIDPLWVRFAFGCFVLFILCLLIPKNRMASHRILTNIARSFQ